MKYAKSVPPINSSPAPPSRGSLLYYVWRDASESGLLAQRSRPSPNEQPWLPLVLEHVSHHYAHPITLASLAAVAHLSRAHFSSAFRRATGIAPIDYLRRYRLQRAKELLGDGTSVAGAAAATGFSDPSYFGRVFRRAESVPPSQFNRSKRNPDSA